MNRSLRMFAASLCLMGAVLTTTTVSAANLLTNGDFETGTLAPSTAHARKESSRHSPETADMHRAAAAALRTLKHHQGAWKAMNVLQEATQLANPAAGRITDETLRRIRVLTDGASHCAVQ